ncbi:MAG: YkgJ family cysteine cluster protein [Bryobacteraceae bacterium]
MPEVRFDLRFGGHTMSARIQVPAEPIRPVDLLPVLHEFNDALIGAAVEQVESQGRRVSCRAGCGACCRQIIAISETEARYLADLIAAMPEDRKQRVTARFTEVVEALAASGLLERLRAEPPSDPAERNRLGLEYLRQGLACPFLEDEGCSIHPHRPASCREYLVTSPAENCSTPRADNILMVELPAKVSRVLYRFSDGEGDQPARWMALPLLLEWAAEHREDAQPAIPGPELFANFMNKLVKK